MSQTVWVCPHQQTGQKPNKLLMASKILFYMFLSCQPQVKKHMDPLLEKVLLTIISLLISFGLQYEIYEFLTFIANVEGAY